MPHWCLVSMVSLWCPTTSSARPAISIYVLDMSWTRLWYVLESAVAPCGLGMSPGDSFPKATTWPHGMLLSRNDKGTRKVRFSLPWPSISFIFSPLPSYFYFLLLWICSIIVSAILSELYVEKTCSSFLWTSPQHWKPGVCHPHLNSPEIWGRISGASGANVMH